MVCQHCGNLLPEGATVCDQCGAEIPSRVREGRSSGSRRQGKDDRPAAADRGGSVQPADMPYYGGGSSYAANRRTRGEDAGKPGVQKGAPQPAATARQSRTRQEMTKPVHRMMVNWAMVGAILLVLLVFAVIGGYVFLKVTDTGQLILARMGRETSATALWAYGQELLDEGHVARAIATYEQACEMEPEREDMYEMLIRLADAYEAAGRTADAERVYTRMYTEIDQENTYAYKEIMRLMEGQGRQMELSSFLSIAYENTKDSYFRRQRENLLPSPPTASEEAGSRKFEQDVELRSAEDYEIYYLIGDDGILPEDGTLYQQSIHLKEGTYVIRAVAVSSNLVSDEMRVQYTITVPTPLAPGISLAPGTYEKRQRIWLKHIESEDEMLLRKKQNKTETEKEILAKLSDITIYYTVDGQTPTSNSPIFDGEPFYLPAGSCTLKAVAVNGFGKVSNVLERTYKVKTSFKKFFNEADEFADFSIMKTTRDQFVKKFGKPESEKSVTDNTVTGNAIQLTYQWGRARFCQTDAGNVLYLFETDRNTVVGPRKTKIGMSETDVTSLYRDMGQAHDQNGDRSIYHDVLGIGKLYHLGKTNDRLDYLYYREDGGTVTLSYYLVNGKVNKMGIKCSYK